MKNSRHKRVASNLLVDKKDPQQGDPGDAWLYIYTIDLFLL